MKKSLILFLAISLASPSLAQNWSKSLEKQAKKGDAEAQCQVGVSYLKGEGTDKNVKKAAKWLFLSAGQGNASAKQHLLSFHSKELEKLAKSGDAEAQLSLGELFLQGKTVGKDVEKSAFWFNEARKQGNKEGLQSFCARYSKLLEKAAKDGNADLQYALGKCYYEGKGTMKDTEIAAEWFEKAMKNGHKEATRIFYSYESKRRAKSVKTWLLHSWFEYTGGARGNFWTGYTMVDSPCRIILGAPRSNGSYNVTPTEDVVIKGYKIGDKIENATVSLLTEELIFKGNLEFDSDDEEVNVKILKGGSLKIQGDSLLLKSDFDIKMNFSNPHNILYKYNFDDENIFEVTHRLPDDKQSQKMRSTLCDVFHVDKLCPVDTLNWTEKRKLALPEYRTSYSSDKLRLLKVGLDSIYLGNGNVCYVNDDVVMLKNAKGDYMTWTAQGELRKAVKGFKDCYVSYDPGQQSELVFNNGESFKGLCELGKVSAQGYPQYYDDSDSKTEEMLQSIWNTENLSDIEFYIYEGIYTTANGKAIKWESGFSEEQIRTVYQALAADEAQARAEAVKQLKAQSLKVKKQLLAEGYKAKDVTQLIDHCNIYNGMSGHLIDRAIALGGNVKRKLAVNPNNPNKTSIIEIYDMNSGERAFMQVVQFDWITYRVRYVGPDFP